MQPSRPTPETAPATLPRVLGAPQATAIVVGTIIGSGIFLVPREMMQDTGSSSLVFLAWIVGGLLSLFGAMTYAELGAMLPYAGGEYIFIRGAYGDTPAFLYMWTWFAVAKPASIAAVTIGLARTLGFFPAFYWLNAQVISAHVPLVWSQLFAIAVTWLITGLNYLGIKKAGDFQLIFTILKVVLILVVVVFCFAWTSGTFANFSTTLPNATGGFTGFMAALIATLWAYDGWSDLTMVAGEVRRPGRSLPIALIGGLFLVGRSLHGHQRGHPIRLARRANRSQRSPRRRRTLRRCRPRRRWLRRRCHGPQHLCRAQRNRHVRRAHPLRRCARPPLLPPVRAHSPALPVPIHIAGHAGAALHHPAALPKPLSAVLRSGHLFRVALLHAHCHHGLRIPPQASQRSNAPTESGDTQSSPQSSSSAPPSCSSKVLPAISAVRSSAPR